MTQEPGIDITVESLGGLGDGIASAGGRPVFIPKSVPGDRLRVRIVHENQHGLQGEIAEILTPGPQRQDPPCEYFSQCGGCTLQQLEAQHYEVFKTRMLHGALDQAGFPLPQAEVLFLPAATRRRVTFQVRQEAPMALSFFALRSRRHVAIEHCLILRPELEALMAALNRELPALPFAPQITQAGLTLADSGIDLVLGLKGSGPFPASLPDALCQRLGVSRISLRAEEGEARVVAQAAPVEMHLGPYRVALVPDAFLQATAEGQAALTALVQEGVGGMASVADLFCGIGTYSFPLSQHARVHAYESSPTMIAAVKRAAHDNGLALACEQRDLFKHPLSPAELDGFAAVVMNPPRVGAKAQAEQLAQSSVSRVVMVSCNTATFARDARILKQAGFVLTAARGIDQFVWSPYLEIVGIFNR